MSLNSSFSRSPFRLFSRLRIKPGMVWGAIIITALIAFESFNYSTTDYALKDLLGDLKFAGIPWATILTIAFCGIDFAGIARIFTPQRGSDEPREVWYLFGAWLLAATMNAALTWWGVAMAIANHRVQSASVINPETINNVVPVFVAIMVWVIRILIIGSLTYAGDRIFSTERRSVSNSPSARPRPLTPSGLPVNSSLSSLRSASASSPRSSYSSRPMPESIARPEPTYHSLSARPAPTSTNSSDNNTRRM